MGIRSWWQERKARKESKRRLQLQAVVSSTTALEEIEELKGADEDTFSATSAFLLAKKSVDDATEAKRTARGAAQRILGMFEKDKK